jgi:hypothetical protein
VSATPSRCPLLAWRSTPCWRTAAGLADSLVSLDAGAVSRRRVLVSGYSATFAWRAGRYRMTTVTSTVLPQPPERCPSSAA